MAGRGMLPAAGPRAGFVPWCVQPRSVGGEVCQLVMLGGGPEQVVSEPRCLLAVY